MNVAPSAPDKILRIVPVIKGVSQEEAQTKETKMTDTAKENSGKVAAENQKERRKRIIRPFPACGFEEALEFAKSIFVFGSGQQVRRLSLFDHLDKSPESGPSRMLITNSSKYGLIEGSYKSEHLKLSDQGIIAVNDEAPKREQVKARIQLAITSIEPFQKLYERFVGNKLPARTALIDVALEAGLEKEAAEEAVDTFILNLRFIGLLQMLSGAERIVTIEHLLDSLPATPLQTNKVREDLSHGGTARPATHVITKEQANFETICFYVTPIGEEGSEQRKHSDLFISSIVEPALERWSRNLGHRYK